MEQLTFDKLPEAIGKLFDRLDRIENLIAHTHIGGAEEKEDTLLSISEASIFLNLKVPTIYGLVSRSAIPHNKVGKKLYFSKQDLFEWIKSGRKMTVAETMAKATEYLQLKKS